MAFKWMESWSVGSLNDALNNWSKFKKTKKENWLVNEFTEAVGEVMSLYKRDDGEVSKFSPDEMITITKEYLARITENNAETHMVNNQLTQDIKDFEEDLADAENEVTGLKAVVDGQQEIIAALLDKLDNRDDFADLLVDFIRR